MKYLFNSEEHIHTLDEKPLCGTSTVCGIVAKPLTWWSAGKAVEIFGWLNPKKFSASECLEKAKSAFETIKLLDIENYQALLKKAYYAHSEAKDVAAEDGTSLHQEIEDYIKSLINGEDMAVSSKVVPFKEWADKNVVRFLYSEAHCYSEKFWLGGISDFAYEDKDGKIWIGDIKSSKEAYFSQFLQLALYDIQISENGVFTNEGEKILEPLDIYGYAIFPFGNGFTEPSLRIANDTWESAAIGAVNLYKLNQQV